MDPTKRDKVINEAVDLTDGMVGEGTSLESSP